MEELCADMIVSLVGIIVTCALLIMFGGSVWLHGVTKALCKNGGGMVDCGGAEIIALRRARLALRGPSHREIRSKQFQIREG